VVMEEKTIWKILWWAIGITVAFSFSSLIIIIPIIITLLFIGSGI